MSSTSSDRRCDCGKGERKCGIKLRDIERRIELGCQGEEGVCVD